VVSRSGSSSPPIAIGVSSADAMTRNTAVPTAATNNRPSSLGSALRRTDGPPDDEEQHRERARRSALADRDGGIGRRQREPRDVEPGVPVAEQARIEHPGPDELLKRERAGRQPREQRRDPAE